MKPFQTCSNTTYATDRRSFLRQTAVGFGWLAFAAMKAGESANAESKSGNPLAPKPPHFPAKARRVIFIFLDGGPSHVDSFDWKPKLARMGAQANSRYLAPVFDFHPRGNSGLMISDAFPHLAKQADELCLLNGMQTNNPGHHQAVVALHTGNENFVRPSVGAWVTYGLGSEADSLPGFVTIDPIGDKGGAANFGSAFLPATFQGTRLSSGSRGVPNISNRSLTMREQRMQLDFVKEANQRLLERDQGNPEIEGLIESAELAFRMQTSVPETLDLSRETQATQELYGLDDPTTSSFATQCLMARRLAEKGVRFMQLTSAGWDHHTKMKETFSGRAVTIDKPIAGLITDLKQRDLLKDTLIVWGGEFRADAEPRQRRRTRPQCQRLHNVDGGRRRQRRFCAMARPMSWAAKRWKASSGRTTCTLRSCTSWDWITSD